ncbi:Kinesin-like protein NACK2 [Dendrobium catenatum]|uniref:Kinesin-like protein n=1 Tax=Dendrobium catenatum TaxID=906689 RepID=A0A2I0VXT1_9ASPA|nr:Kinesin-like protein NACK2 [Dendrobium catenatum]
MAGPSFSSSSSRTRSSSPFSQRRPLTSSYSSTSSSASSFMNGRLIPRSSPSSASSNFYGSGGIPRSVTPNRSRCDYSSNRAPIGFVSADELVMDAGDATSSGDSITVTVRFRPLSEREFQRGDEIAWYADGDKVARCEYNPATAYAFDRVFGPSTTSQVIYDVAARPVVKAAMEGINEHRHVGSNNFNLFSSRSHTIFTLMVESSARGDEYDGVMYSQLNLIDLAGSESSKTETTGQRRKEGSFINKSLLTLGTVSANFNMPIVVNA